jgi:CBS domain containing-hemolysin-like protein
MTTYQSDYPVLDLTSKFVGVLTRPLLIQALQVNGPEGRVVDVMIPADAVQTVAPTTNLADVWELMAANGSRVVAVKDGAEFLGLITLEDINEVFHVMGATMTKGGRPTPPTNLPSTPTSQPTERTAADA